MKICDKCGTVNYAPYAIKDKVSVCEKCLSALAKSGSTKPVLGHSIDGGCYHISPLKLND